MVLLTMPRPLLALRPNDSVTTITPRPAMMYSDSEWAAAYPEIERLYIHKRQKLRNVMQYMEREHGFKATVQMYKKRFAKWGFQRYFRRSAAPAPASRTRDEDRKSMPPGELGLMLASPRFSQHDALKLMFLASVRTWSLSFFEFVQSGDGFLVSEPEQLSMDQPRSAKIKKISSAFKLVIDLLDRDEGKLAGRVARKAFLLVEDVLTLDGPTLIWNLLEMIYNMAHPLSTMLHSLRGLVADLTSAASYPGGSSPSFLSSSRSSLTDRNGTKTTTGSWLLSHALSALLEQAWISNTKIIFDHFDPGLLPLYCGVYWDSCSIQIPVAIVNPVIQWIAQIEAWQLSSTATTETYLADKTLVGTLFQEHRMLRRLLESRMDASSQQDFEGLCASSIPELRKQGGLILSKGISSVNCGTNTLMGNLAGLVTAKLLEGRPATARECSCKTSRLMMKMPRNYAGSVACSIRTLIDLNVDSGGDGIGTSLGTAERIRAIVALRGYAQGQTDPQIVRDIWQLEKVLIAAEEYEEAQEVGRDAYYLLEKYVQDIPVSSA